MVEQWDVPLFYTSREEAERTTGHFAVATMVVNEALGRHIVAYLRKIGVLTFQRQNKAKTSDNDYTVNFIARFYIQAGTVWFTEGGSYGNLAVPEGHSFKGADGDLVRFAPSLSSIENFNRVVDATPTLTQIYYWCCARYREGIIKMRYTRDRSPHRTAVYKDDFGPDLIPDPDASRNQSRRLVPAPGAYDRLASRKALRTELMSIRQDAAQRMKVPPYIILHDHQIERLIEERPRSPQALADLIGPKKAAQHGDRILEAIGP